MKLNDFLNEHTQWISNNVPGEYPYSEVLLGKEKVAPVEFETLEVGEDPLVTINGQRITHPSFSE